MRIFSFIPALAALATAVVGVALPGQGDCSFETACEPASKRGFSGEHAARNDPGLTNAALLRRGLPIKKPIMKSRRDIPDRRSNKRILGPYRKEGYIPVAHAAGSKREHDDALLGYVSSHTINHAQYQYGNISSALVVTFDVPELGRVCQVNIRPKNSDIKDFPFLGLVQGRDDVNSTLARRSFQYTYLASTNETAPGSPPVYVGNSYTRATGLKRTSESAIWIFDPANGSLTPVWVNPDKSVPILDYFVQGTAIYAGGDAHAFSKKYDAPVTLIKFKFIGLN